MNSKTIRKLCETRLTVGFLGEKHQRSWWSSSFLSHSSKPFLNPIFTNSIRVAQYSGVCKAACIVHDKQIGIGKYYHLFRLPDSVEYSLLKCVQTDDFSEYFFEVLSNRETALNWLAGDSPTEIQKLEGPLSIGDYSDNKLKRLVDIAKQHYFYAMKNDYITLPYMR